MTLYVAEPDDFAYQNVALESENDEDDANVYDSISVSDLYKVIKMKSEDENAAFKKEYSVNFDLFINRITSCIVGVDNLITISIL